MNTYYIYKGFQNKYSTIKIHWVSIIWKLSELVPGMRHGALRASFQGKSA